MSLKRIVFLIVASCGAREEQVVARPEPLPKPVVAIVDASAPAPIAEVCFEPRAASAADFDEARARFQAQKWPDAAAMFRAIAFGASSEPVGIYAAELYLESLNQLSRERKSCFGDMQRDIQKLRDVYCAAQRAKHEDACNIFDRVQIDLGRMRAEKLAAGEQHAQAAAAYLALLQGWCLPAKEPFARCDEIAFNAAVSFLATGDEAAAKRVRAMMVDPNNKMDKSPLVEKLDCRIDPTSRPRCH